MNILMVCLGNICRSPLAHGILNSKIQEYNLSWHVDSAGTGNWHVGESPDRRAIVEAMRNGIDISAQRARQITERDFQEFDLILVMDTQNYNDVMALAQDETSKEKVHMILNYIEEGKNMAVPDPYYDGRFSLVYDLLEQAIDELINKYATEEVL